MSDDLRRVLDLLDDGAQSAGPAGECTPPCDVVETGAAIELVMDLPGVTRDSLRIVLVGDTFVVAGQKLPAACEHRGAAFPGGAGVRRVRARDSAHRRVRWRLRARHTQGR